MNRKHFIAANPSLTQLVGVPLLVGATTTFSGALVVGLISFAALLLTTAASFPTRTLSDTRGQFYMRVLLAAGFTVALIPFVRAFLPEVAADLGIWLPLCAVNSLVHRTTKSETFALSIGENALVGLGYLTLLCIIGAVRELLGTGAISEFRLLADGFPLLQTGAGGLLLFGGLLAFFGAVRAKTESRE